MALTGVPWTTGGDDVYEDWYLVQDFAALGILNDAAVSASRAVPHDAAAALASGGIGGLYRLRQGVVTQPRVAHWFSKPDGMPYRTLFAQLAPVVEQCDGALWMRQLVLGPAPEFCLHSGTTVSLAAELSPLVMPLRTVWPSP